MISNVVSGRSALNSGTLPRGHNGIRDRDNVARRDDERSSCRQEVGSNKGEKLKYKDGFLSSAQPSAQDENLASAHLKKRSQKRNMSKKLVAVIAAAAAASFAFATMPAQFASAAPANSQSAQASQSAQPSQQAAGNQTTEDQLLQAVARAKKAGVTVTEDPQQQKQSQAEVSDDYAQQIKQLNDVTAKQEANMKAYNDSKSSRQAQIDQIKKSAMASDDDNSLYVTGSFNNAAKGKDFYKNMSVVYAGTDPSVKVLSSVGYTKDTQVTSNAQLEPSTEDWRDIKPLYKVKSLKEGDQFTFSNAAQTSDGQKLQVRYTVTNINRISPNGDVTFYVGYGHDSAPSSIAFDYSGANSVSLKIEFLDAQSNPVKVVLGTVVSDIDHRQGEKMTFPGNKINMIQPPNSGLALDAAGGYYYDTTGLESYALDGAPTGTVFVAGIGSQMDLTFYMEPHPSAAAGATSDVLFSTFGAAAGVRTVAFNQAPSPLAARYHLDTAPKPAPTPVTPAPKPSQPSQPAKPASPKPAPKPAPRVKPAAVKPAPKKELARTGVSILPLAGVALAVLVLAGVALAFRRKQKPENK